MQPTPASQVRGPDAPRRAQGGGACGPSAVPSPGRERIIPNPKLKLLDQVREVMRLKHYSIRTERCYCDWVRRYVRFHEMKSRSHLDGAEGKIERFLSDLAVNGKVSASTQNQAFNALLFLYREVLGQELGNIQALRAERPERVPTVLTPEEVRQVIVAMSGTPQLVVKLLYGSGLRLLEALRLRIKDIDFAMKQLTVRDGKGAKDRYTVLPEAVVVPLREHLERVRLTHQEDLKKDGGAVYLPGALERKYRGAARQWIWQYAFPARDLSCDPRSGQIRRHHVDEATIHRAIKTAVARVGIAKRVSSHTFRHSFAIHALQRGADRRTHVLRTGGSGTKSPLD